MASERPTTRPHRSTWRSQPHEGSATDRFASQPQLHSLGGLSGSFRRLALFPVSAVSGGPASGRLAPVYVPAAYGAAGRGLLPLPAEQGSGRALGLNVPLWGLAWLFVAFSLLWSATIGQTMRPPAALPLVDLTDRAAAVAQVIRSTAAAFPRAQSVVLARLRPSQPSEWLLVEVDGRSLRAPASAAGIQAALAAAGVDVAEDDRVLVLPNEGTPLVAAGSRAKTPVPTERVVVQRAIPFSVVDSGVPYSGHAVAATVGDALRAVGIDVDGADLVQPPADSPLAPGVRVAIMRAQPVAVTGPDVQLEGRTRATTIADLLAEWNVALGPLDRVEPPPDAAVPAGGTVRVVRVHEEEEKQVQLVPFRTEVRYDERLVPGTRVRLRTGVAGLVERLVKVVFEDGAEVQRVVAGEAVLRPPVDEVFAAGPAVMPVVSLPGVAAAANTASDLQPGENVRRVVTMVATGYDPGPASTGKRPGDPGYGITATGLRAGYGVVAVDPRVIPFYTRLYIPGYGYAVAADTGSAIVGNRIDLGFATYGEAIRWGRRSVSVYVLS